MKDDKGCEVTTLSVTHCELRGHIDNPIPEQGIENDLADRSYVKSAEAGLPTKEQPDDDNDVENKINNVKYLPLERCGGPVKAGQAQDIEYVNFRPVGLEQGYYPDNN